MNARRVRHLPLPATNALERHCDEIMSHVPIPGKHDLRDLKLLRQGGPVLQSLPHASDFVQVVVIACVVVADEHPDPLHCEDGLGEEVGSQCEVSHSGACFLMRQVAAIAKKKKHGETWRRHVQDNASPERTWQDIANTWRKNLANTWPKHGEPPTMAQT